MTIPLYPSDLPGLGYSTYKRPISSTRVSTHVSGREVRAVNYVYPLYEFELIYNGLSSSSRFAGVGANSLQELLGFFLKMQGQFGVFRYVDPSDNAVAAQSLGTGDGTTNAFTFVRNMGGWIEPVGMTETVTAVYFNGVSHPSGWTVSGNTLNFTSAPSIGVAISADFTFSFLCRFSEDQHEYEQLMQSLWTNKSVKFRSVRSA